MKKFLTLSLITFFAQSAQAAAPAPAEYPYSAHLKAGPVQVSQAVEAEIDQTSLRHIRPDFGNIQVLDDLNGEVPFRVFDVPAGPVKAGSSVVVSEPREEADPAVLFDNNRLTAYPFSDRIEANEPATILVDFGVPVALHRIEIWPTFAADIKGMELRSSMSKEALRTMKRRGEFEAIIDGDYSPARFVEISLWGTDVMLEDVNFFEKAKARVYFQAEPERRYRLLYGDLSMDNKRFTERVSESQNVDQIFAFAAGSFNPLAGEDFDGDGVNNEADNCPVISNKSQNDEDEDRIGDPCDNAVEVKNFSQLDVDRDGVADLIDNCKLQPNPDQKDRDNDGFGDECDDAYGKESVFEKWTTRGSEKSDNDSLPYGLIGGILALLAVAGIGISLGKKKK